MSLPWYSEGLKFSCTECGKCCTGSPGFTWVSDEEIHSMANHLRLDIQEFGRKYLRKIGNKYALLEDPKNYDCIFLKENKCSIYHARPKQCRTFPWWHQNLTSQEAWENVARECEGINRGERVTSREEIDCTLSQ